MATRIKRGGKRIRGSDGKRTRTQSCCCGGCTETTPQGIAEYIRDNLLQPTFTVEAADFTDACAAGDCSPVAGVYSLPFDFIASTGSGNYQVDWSDTFTLTTCGVSRSIFARAQMFIVTTGAVDVVVNLQSSFATPILMRWTESFPWTVCNDVLTINGQLLPVNTSGSGRTCYTLTTDGSVEFVM